MRISNYVRRFALAAALSACAAAVEAAPISGLFATGVDGSGNALADSAADSHYSILSPSQSAIVIQQSSIPSSWFANSPTARWIWQTNNGQPTNVTLTFRTTFDLTGLDASTATINGSWATDNSGLDIRINGNSTGNACAGFSSLCAFSVTSGFVSGTNTLDFVVRDVGSISGFLVTSIGGTADELANNRIPEPGSLILLGASLLGFSLVAGLRRRMR